MKFEGYVEMFDMVSNFPMDDGLKMYFKEVYVEPTFIEPLIPLDFRETQEPYSYLGQGNYYRRGTSSVMICAYARMKMYDARLDAVWAIDISAEVKIAKDFYSLEYMGEHYKIHKREIYHKDIYIRWYDNEKYKVYEIVRFITRVGNGQWRRYKYSTRMRDYFIEQVDHELFQRNFIKGEIATKFYEMPLKFYSFPRNHYDL